MNFTSTTTAPTVKVIKNKMPKVSIAHEALVKMYEYVKQCSDEIGWLGTVVEKDGGYLIEDTFLFEQEVHATTTEIKPEGLQKFAEELLAQPNGMETWNNMRMWGHSHVNMGTTPSGQDDSQMVEFENIGHDFFIRLIANKKGSLRIDFFNYKLGITYLDMPWTVEYTGEMAVFFEQIQQLAERFKAVEQQSSLQHGEAIKEEIKTLVRKKTWNTGASRGSWTGLHGGKLTAENEYGRYVNGRWVSWTPQEKEERKLLAEMAEEREELLNKSVDNESGLNYFYTTEDVERGLGDDVYDFIGLMRTEVIAELELQGYLHPSEQDIRLVIQTANQYNQLGGFTR